MNQQVQIERTLRAAIPHATCRGLDRLQTREQCIKSSASAENWLFFFSLLFPYLGVTVAAAEHELDEYCRNGHANIEVDDDGVIYYDFPALRFA